MACGDNYPPTRTRLYIRTDWRKTVKPDHAFRHVPADAWEDQSVFALDRAPALGAVRTGRGRWNRNAHEVRVVAPQGEMPRPAPGTQFPSLILAPVGEHSEKPDLFADMIAAIIPGVARLEMLARKPRTGWTSQGNELNETGFTVPGQNSGPRGHATICPPVMERCPEAPSRMHAVNIENAQR